MLTGLLLISGLCHVQSQPATDYSIQANIIYRFTKYIDWPDTKKSGDFIIGVVGNGALYDQLKAFVANKTAGNQKIIVRKFSAYSTTFNCHILFIGDEEGDSIKKIASVTSGNALLIVTESEGLTVKGSCINLLLEDEHIKLEINKNNIEQRNLNIASELLALGKIIQ